MKIATIVVRILLGTLFLFSSISFLLHLFPTPVLEGNMKTFNEGLIASGYILPLLKSVELLCGIAFVSGFFVRLANVVIFPISINILFTHLFLAPEGIPIALFVIIANLFLISRYWDTYKSLFKP